MNPIHYAGYVIVPLHLVAGFLFALPPASPAGCLVVGHLMVMLSRR